MGQLVASQMSVESACQSDTPHWPWRSEWSTLFVLNLPLVDAAQLRGRSNLGDLGPLIGYYSKDSKNFKYFCILFYSDSRVLSFTPYN